MTQLHYLPNSYGLLLPPSNVLPNLSTQVWYLIGTAFQVVQEQQSDLVIKSLTYDKEIIVPKKFFVPIHHTPPTRCSALRFEIVEVLNQVYGTKIQFESDVGRDLLLTRIGCSISITKDEKYWIIERISKTKKEHSSLLDIFEDEEKKSTEITSTSKRFSKEIENRVVRSLCEWFELLQDFGSEHD